MMAQRPGLLDLRSHSDSSTGSAMKPPLRSPRLHVAGEAPPELSPLDAFALQSRLLAQQLQESTKDGNRISRLPPLTVDSPLMVQGRSEYFRSMSQESPSDAEFVEEGPSPHNLGFRTEVEDAFESLERPKSVHARMSQIPASDEPVPAVPSLSRLRPLDQVHVEQGFFEGARTRSPSPILNEPQQHVEKPHMHPLREKASSLRSRSPAIGSMSSPTRSETTKQSSTDEAGLLPPRSLFPKRSSSIMSSPLVPLEDDASAHMTGSFHSLPHRKLSSGSLAISNPIPSPLPTSVHRSPSVSSEISILPRPSFNFSRPLSRAGTPGLESPSRQASSDSQPSFVLADENAHTPVSMHSEAFLEQQLQDGSGGAPSYIYSKFALPRGKTVQRLESSDDQTADPSQLKAWPNRESDAQHQPVGPAPPSPPLRPSSSYARTVPFDSASMVSSMPRPSTEAGKPSLDSFRLGSSRPSYDSHRVSEDSPRGRSRTSPLHDASPRGRPPASVGTSDSASTIRPPPTARSNAPSAMDMSAEEHLSKGVECHENGSLNESTYHLRHAARMNNPTAMLLYALACRHGWGMRANQKEGVEWLRKAAEHASIEIAVDEEQAQEGKHVDVVDRKTRKAQFALSIYELGMSHMNGWGIGQDKALGLRCFEIAGNWGDVDALAEAGFCYAQGVGCKKNLKTSAKFYRMAEAKGMNMVGNSWIHKPKYQDDEDSSKKDIKKRARSKSRTRAMFGRKS